MGFQRRLLVRKEHAPFVSLLSPATKREPGVLHRTPEVMSDLEETLRMEAICSNEGSDNYRACNQLCTIRLLSYDQGNSGVGKPLFLKLKQYL